MIADNDYRLAAVQEFIIVSPDSGSRIKIRTMNLAAVKFFFFKSNCLIINPGHLLIFEMNYEICFKQSFINGQGKVTNIP
jgi:hypothetical protein